MSNTLSGYNTFVARTLIESSKVNENFTTIKNRAALWQAYSVTAAQLAAIGATVTGQLALFSLSSTEVLDGFIVKHSTAFSGGAISSGVVRCGLSSNDGYFTDDFQVVTQAVAAAANLASSNLSPLFTNTTVYLTASLTGGNLSALAAGGLTVYVRRAELP